MIQEEGTIQDEGMIQEEGAICATCTAGKVSAAAAACTEGWGAWPCLSSSWIWERTALGPPGWARGIPGGCQAEHSPRAPLAPAIPPGHSSEPE